MISEHGVRFFAILLLLVLAGCREALLHDLAELDANRAITRLQSSGVEAFKARQADGKWTIEVESKDAPTAIRILDEARALIVSRREQSEGSSFFASREEQIAHTQTLIASQIEQTLMSLSGVLDARVHLSSGPEEPGSPSAVRSAGVLVVHARGSDPSREDIASLVAGASGVSLERVSVVFRDVEPAAIPMVTRPGGGEAARYANGSGVLVAGVLSVACGGWLVLAASRGIRRWKNA